MTVDKTLRLSDMITIGGVLLALIVGFTHNEDQINNLAGKQNQTDQTVEKLVDAVAQLKVNNQVLTSIVQRHEEQLGNAKPNH